MLIATIKSGTVPPYLTEGKRYKVEELKPCINSNRGRSFWIVNDRGRDMFCVEKNSRVLRGGDWELTERPEE